MRREYRVRPLLINGRIIQKLVIDPHVDKHADHVTDEVIKNIVKKLNGGQFHPLKREEGFSYYATKVNYNENWYKLVWLLEDESLYIGVITVYRDRRIK